MIRFSQASITNLEDKCVLDALHQKVLSGDGKYTMLVYEQFKKRFGIQNMLLTTSGTTALEMTALLLNLKQGDEVIVPSFTFSSTVNAFVLRGAKPVFCDVRPDTMNIDENLIEDLITPKTKAIYVIHYAGVPCEINTINEIAKKHNLPVVEDAAQAVGSSYEGRAAGTLTDLGCYSFHETKNYIMGEGGAILVNRAELFSRAEIIREKGTDRKRVLRGLVDKYTWQDIGSSYLPSDILAALLYAQMERYDEIMRKRMTVWNTYQTMLSGLKSSGDINIPFIPSNVTHNAHLYNVLLPTAQKRLEMIDKMKKSEIMTYICYIPLHSSPMGKSFGYTAEMLPITEDHASRLLRLPLSAEITADQAEFIAKSFIAAFKE